MGVVDFQTSGNSAVCSMANAGRDGDGGGGGGGGGGCYVDLTGDVPPARITF